MDGAVVALSVTAVSRIDKPGRSESKNRKEPAFPVGCADHGVAFRSQLKLLLPPE